MTASESLTPAQNAANFLAANHGMMYVSIGSRQFERNSAQADAVRPYCTGFRSVDECDTATSLPGGDCRTPTNTKGDPT